MVVPLKPGTKAPHFALPSTEGTPISLESYRGKKNVVLYFYPENETAGCTAEACNFRDDMKLYAMKDAIILGVSTDDLESHLRFKEKYQLPFTLLSDSEALMSRAFGVYDEEANEARRVTFIIGKDGIIKKVFDHVKVAHHSKEVLENF